MRRRLIVLGLAGILGLALGACDQEVVPADESRSSDATTPIVPVDYPAPTGDVSDADGEPVAPAYPTP
jgi:hypothetical protein